jgi:hypothetical protein
MTWTAPAVIALLLGLASAAAARLPGGGSPDTDCWAVWEGVTEGSSRCADGDPTCDDDGQVDGACTFGVNVCVAQTDVAGCTPVAVRSVRARRLERASRYVSSPLEPPQTPVTTPVCGSAAVVRLPLRGRTRSRASKKLVLHMVATGEGRTRDRDRLTLQCVPPDPAGASACADNPAGGPRELRLTVTDGSDIDLGFVGLAHSFQFATGTTFRQCLTECDGAADPACVAAGATGAGSLNGPTLGPPLPLTVAGVTNCLVNRFDSPIAGTTNVETGAIDLEIGLRTAVYVLSDCPECDGEAIGDSGRCAGGPSRGRVCRVEGTLRTAAGRLLRLSSACPPEAKSGRPREVPFRLRVSTGRRALDGSRPCPGQPEDDRCGSGTCSARCSGAACIAEQPDPVAPGATICVDAKGGVSQLCCSNDATTPCFPSGGAGGQIERVGRATPPLPASPGETYPKRAAAVVVDTFCLPATGDNSIDASVTGLPGPGAAITPLTACWSRDRDCSAPPP